MPRVLIEGKPVLRPLNLLPIQFQESAQMVAWIKGDTELSQKINTIYGHEYIEYLVDRNPKEKNDYEEKNDYDPPFMNMD
ncbi:unnamed protein product [Penicillium nalgiovense]|nr:unnamed protein product [Penicillium nalgiovense]CAG8101872.1 unnamed protein product [Penicillium nalgiovense]CAG8126866.1 unnamed protein product [Penicillium nalgiovense]CAG8237797.1 unnamed protein product [Penicillium nalgiovense]CAG8278048.1 unnamed protein product [Penicillium nalgiovense]